MIESVCVFFIINLMIAINYGILVTIKRYYKRVKGVGTL